MILNITSSEISLLQNEQSDKVLWSQKVGSKKPRLLYFLATFFLLAIILYLYNFFSNGINAKTVLELLWNMFYFYAIMYGTMIYLYRASTTKYFIYPGHIKFEWGFSKKKSAEIPFHDIKNIQLVTYNNKDTSTIYFGTGEVYEDVLRLDFENHDTRPHITFEKVQNGEKVYELLNNLHKAAKKN